MTAAEHGIVTPVAVRFGLKLPNCGGVLCPPAWATPATMDELAGSALAGGFHSLWLHDHLAVPDELAHLEQPSFFEPLITMARLATTYPTLTIGVATVILPFREPALLTKQIATLGAWFPGRIIVGLGLGRYESEYRSLGFDLYRVRGKVANEYLDVIEALLGDGPATIAGPRRQLDGATMYPKRNGPADPAVWVAGNSPAGVARAARYADGWIGASLGPAEIAGLAEPFQRGRPRPDEPFEIALSATIRRIDESSSGSRAEGLHVHASAVEGDAGAVAGQLDEYVAAGVRHFLLSFGVGSIEQVRDDVGWFAERVIPAMTLGRPSEAATSSAHRT